MRQALDSANPVEMNGFVATEEQVPEEAEEVLKPTLLAQKLAKGKFVFAVEMDPPRGLSTHKLMAGASLLAEAGGGCDRCG